MDMRPARNLIVLGCLTGVLLTACSSPPGGLDSPVSSLRISAAADAAREHRQSAVPELIVMLDSDDPAVRLAAIRSLEEITGQTHGYRHFDPEPVRAQAVQRWVDWSRKQGEGSAASADSRPIERRP